MAEKVVMFFSWNENLNTHIFAVWWISSTPATSGTSFLSSHQMLAFWVFKKCLSDLTLLQWRFSGFFPEKVGKTSEFLERLTKVCTDLRNFGATVKYLEYGQIFGTSCQSFWNMEQFGNDRTEFSQNRLTWQVRS